MRNLEKLNQEFEKRSAHEIIAWAMEQFASRIAMSSSFQTQSLPLLHIVSQVSPELPVIFLDTGYHFPETLAFRDEIAERFGLNLKIMRAAMSRAAFLKQYGDDLYRRNPDLCCYINKVEPLERAMQGLDAWISGIRRDQSPARAHASILEQTPQGTIRIHPFATWTREDVERYRADHDLPEHPLTAQGYPSIGCAPCTQPVAPDGNERDGRWANQNKTECGLHTVLRQPPEHRQPLSVDSIPLIQLQGDSGDD